MCKNTLDIETKEVSMIQSARTRNQYQRAIENFVSCTAGHSAHCVQLGHLDDDHMTIWTWTISVHLGDRFCESLAQLPSLSESEYYGKVE